MSAPALVSSIPASFPWRRSFALRRARPQTPASSDESGLARRLTHPQCGSEQQRAAARGRVWNLTVWEMLSHPPHPPSLPPLLLEAAPRLTCFDCCAAPASSCVDVFPWQPTLFIASAASNRSGVPLNERVIARRVEDRGTSGCPYRVTCPYRDICLSIC